MQWEAKESVGALLTYDLEKDLFAHVEWWKDFWVPLENLS